MLQWQDEAADEHVGVHQAFVDHGHKLLKLALCGQDGIKRLESFNVELYQFTKEVKAALENLLVTDLILHNVASNMLRRDKITS